MTDITYLNENEIKALVKEADNSRDRAIVSLFLHTGLFVNELCSLKVTAIDWEGKVLKLNSTRTRNIPLNDEVYNELVEWSKERLDNPTDSFFITLKGKVARISPRNVNRLIRKYAEAAGITHKVVNAQVLRNTFAIRYLKKETSIDKALYILGISSLKGMRRYVKIAKEETKPEKQQTEHTDTRPWFIKLISRFIPHKPKEARVLKVPANTDKKEEITIGRAGIMKEINENLKKGISIVLYSKLGLGKTHILKHIAKENDLIYLISPSPAKDLLATIAKKYCPDYEEKLPKKKRSSIREIAEYIMNIVKEQKRNENSFPKEVIVIDNIERLRKSDIELLQLLLETFAIVSATEEMADRLKPIWWKLKRIELEPLLDDSIKALITHHSKELIIENKELLETQILSRASGSPLAVVEMINQVKQLPRVKESDIRSLHHEAGTKYIECSKVVILFWAGALIFRFFSLGTNSFESYIMAGLLATAALVARFFVLKMR